MKKKKKDWRKELDKYRKSLRRIRDGRFRTKVKPSKKIYKRNKKINYEL